MKSNYGGSVCFTDVGSAAKFKEHGLNMKDIANRTLPDWMLPDLSEHEERPSSRPDAILLLLANPCSARPTPANCDFSKIKKSTFQPRQWEVHLIEFKYCEDTRPQNQQTKAEEQHRVLINHLKRQGYKKVQLHVILNGAMGTIYKKVTDEPLIKHLGLDYHQTVKLTRTLNKHAIEYATKIIKTRYALQFNGLPRGNGGAQARNPPDPH